MGGRAVETYHDVVKFGVLLTEGAGMNEPVGTTKELRIVSSLLLGCTRFESTYTVTVLELEEALVVFQDDPGGLE